MRSALKALLLTLMVAGMARVPLAQTPAGAAARAARRQFGTDENAELIFEEHWTNAPMTQPMKQENLGNQSLRLHLYGAVYGKKVPR